MKTKYIVGRPMKIGTDRVEPGDELTKSQIEAIPRLESFISGRFIYPVVTAKDHKALPNFVLAGMKTREEALALAKKNRQSSSGPLKAEVDAAESRKSDANILKAEKQMSLQDFIYARKQAERAQEEAPAAPSGNLIGQKLGEFGKRIAQPDTEDGEQLPETDTAQAAPSAPETAPEPENATPEEEAAPEAKDNDGGTEDGESVVVPDPTATEFNPADHSVAEVKDYIADHPDEEGAIVEAERKGKARKGLIGEFE